MTTLTRSPVTEPTASRLRVYGLELIATSVRNASAASGTGAVLVAGKGRS